MCEQYVWVWNGLEDWMRKRMREYSRSVNWLSVREEGGKSARQSDSQPTRRTAGKLVATQYRVTKGAGIDRLGLCPRFNCRSATYWKPTLEGYVAFLCVCVFMYASVHTFVCSCLCVWVHTCVCL